MGLSAYGLMGLMSGLAIPALVRACRTSGSGFVGLAKKIGCF